MSKILVLSSEFGRSANGVCVKNVVEEMLNNKHDVYVISEGDDYSEKQLKNFRLQYIKMPLFTLASRKKQTSIVHKAFLKVWRVLRGVYASILYPNSSPFFSNKVLRKAIEIIDKEKIDIVICSYLPYSSIYTGLKLRKKYGKELTIVGYHLDLITASNNSSVIIRKYKTMKARHIWEKELVCFDRIIIPEMASISGSDNSNKIKRCGFPVFTEHLKLESNGYRFNPNVLNITFIGSLTSNRNPSYILGLFNEINNKSEKKIILHIWGNIDNNILLLINKFDFVVNHGYVSNEYVNYLLCSSDYLLNIGNSVQNGLIPSKIFQYFSTGKPIINLVKNADDTSIIFFQKYRRFIEIHEKPETNYDVLLTEVYNQLYNTEWSSIDCDLSYFQKYTPVYCMKSLIE